MNQGFQIVTGNRANFQIISSRISYQYLRLLSLKRALASLEHEAPATPGQDSPLPVHGTLVTDYLRIARQSRTRVGADQWVDCIDGTLPLARDKTADIISLPTLTELIGLSTYYLLRD